MARIITYLFLHVYMATGVLLSQLQKIGGQIKSSIETEELSQFSAASLKNVYGGNY